MNGNLSDGIHRQAPPDNPKQFETTQQERELLVKLRLIDYWRTQKMRTIVAEWNGIRLRVFDTTQI